MGPNWKLMYAVSDLFTFQYVIVIVHKIHPWLGKTGQKKAGCSASKVSLLYPERQQSPVWRWEVLTHLMRKGVQCLCSKRRCCRKTLSASLSCTGLSVSGPPTGYTLADPRLCFAGPIAMPLYKWHLLIPPIISLLHFLQEYSLPMASTASK